MTDLRQAAQQALEALEGWEHCDEWVWPVSALEQSKRNTTESLAALRAALEQQAEPTCPDCKAAVLYECVACSSNNYPPKQQAEPVATVTSETGNPNITMSWWHEPALPVGTKLYTAPPQRQWVGLTDEEILSTDPWEILRADPWMGTSDSNINPYQILLKVRTLEAKLKERNT